MTLVVGVDKPHQVAQNNAVLMAQTRTWQHDGGQRRVSDVNCEARWQQGGFTRRQYNGFIKTSAQIKAC